MASPPDVQVSFVDSSSIPGKKRRHAPKSENLKRSSTDPPPKRPRHTALSLSLPVVTGSRAPATQHAFNPHGHLTPATRNGSVGLSSFSPDWLG